ncbi:hypothetical protein F5Y16DRAFT_359447 [Xylariaceae sp. FL0255]|nr:hypothetical protein F5Y16DRAFT_359447 [Xylariaceae sp. FL0255]
MSIRIALDQPPEFYTNLDFLSGRVLLNLQRPETIGNVIIKLEGESRTALMAPTPGSYRGDTSGDSIVTENHKILYKVFQCFPDDGVALTYSPGNHVFKFDFKLPLNNICHDAKMMGSMIGVGGPNGGGLLGKSGFRTMDATKQLMLHHVKATLPPSLTGFPQMAEIRYYVKVTIQRPGIFKENWRYQLGFKFLPIEPPRKPASRQEAFARRPFTFKPRTPLPSSRKSFFGSNKFPGARDPSTPNPPSIEMSARLPFPSILTCNESLPLRLIAKKLVPTSEQVYITALEVVLVGYTQVRVQNLENIRRTVWVIVSTTKLSIELGKSTDAVDTEFEIPKTLWENRRLHNTIAPTFKTCNVSRRYELEVRLSLSWGLPESSGKTKEGFIPQVISLPLKISKIDVFSGIKPPAQLLQSATYTTAPQGSSSSSTRPSAHVNTSTNNTTITMNGNSPRPPNRPGADGNPSMPPRPSDPLYPPQLGPDNVPGYDDAPPSYDEAMAEMLTGPSERPAYSGVTAENAPSTMPGDEKN